MKFSLNIAKIRYPISRLLILLASISESLKFKKIKGKELIKKLIKKILNKIDNDRIKTKRILTPIIFFKPMIRKNKGNNHDAIENKSVITKPKPLNAKYKTDSGSKISKYGNSKYTFKILLAETLKKNKNIKPTNLLII